MVALTLLILIGTQLMYSTAAASSPKPLLGFCVLHRYAFPHGPDAADLTVSFCHLLQEQLPAMPCNDQHDLTASEFLSVYEPQAAFCEENAELIDGVMDDSLPDAQQVRETAVVETLYVLNTNENGERRRLFLGILAAVAGILAVVAVFAGIVCLAAWMSDPTVFGRRRALAAPESVSNALFPVEPTTILQECANGLHSFLCDLPMNEFLHIFTTGVCASTMGLSCVLSQNDVLALMEN